jgi:hypothetical protein
MFLLYHPAQDVFRHMKNFDKAHRQRVNQDYRTLCEKFLQGFAVKYLQYQRDRHSN